MANIKLKNNYWVTEGVYDTTDAKNQKQINAGLHQDIADTVIVSDTQPSASANQIWLPQTIGEGVQVPTWAEHQALSTAFTSLDNEVNIYPNLGTFQKFGVIGDSFASGAINSTVRYGESWVRILANRYGIVYGLYAQSGYSARDFLDTTNANYNNRGYGALLLDNENNYNKCGLFLICLGINDANQDTSSSNIGSSSDIKTDPEQNNDTFWGRYGKIIARLQALNPDARIICCGFKRSYTSTAYDNYNAAIENIATYFQLPYLNPADHPFFNSNLYIDNMVSNHPTAPLYSGYAEAMADLISKTIKTYISYFNSYTGQNTNPSYHEAIPAGDVSVPSGTVTNIASCVLQKGTYLFIVVGLFTANDTGYRQLGLAGTATSSGGGRYLFDQVKGYTGNGTSANKVFFTCIHTVTSDNYTMYLNAYQNSGSTLTCSSAGFRYFKIA